MAEEVEEVQKSVEDFKKEIHSLLNKGLRKISEDDNKKRVKQLEELFHDMIPANWKQSIPVEIHKQITFDWFAN